MEAKWTRYRWLISFLWAFCTVFLLAFSKIISLGVSAFAQENVLALVLIFLFCRLFYTVLPLLQNKRRWIICLCLSVIFACFYMIGQKYYTLKETEYAAKYMVTGFLGMTALLFGLSVWTFHFIETPRRHNHRSLGVRFSKFFALPEKKQFFVIQGLLLVCYIPAFLANYPGLYSFDGPMQVYQILYQDYLSAANPLLNSFLLGGSVWLGHAIFGSYNVGLAFYSWIQMICVTAAFAYAIRFFIRHDLPKWWIGISALFFALNPFFQVFVFTTIKENLFGAALLVLFLDTVDLLMDSETFFHKPALQIRYGVMALLMCLSRNQGIYLWVLTIPFLVWACKIHKMRLTGICVSVVAVYYALTGPLSTALNVHPANYIDAFSIPIQQVSRVMNQTPERVTDEQKQILSEIISLDAFEDYNPVTADPVKSQIHLDVAYENPMRYLKVYLEIGLNNPRAYVDAFFAVNYAYYSPGVYCWYEPKAYKNYE